VSGATVTYDPKYITNMTEAKAQIDFSYFPDYDVETGEYIVRPLSYFLNGSSSLKISGGKVTINLGVPKSENFGNMSYYEDDITVIPNDAKFFVVGIDEAVFLTFNGKYALGCMKDEENFAPFIYSDKDVTMEGTGTDWGYTTRWYVSLKKGWNYLIASFDEATNTATYTASTTLPSGFKWFVVDANY
jgi:hypothetical protein